MARPAAPAEPDVEGGLAAPEAAPLLPSARPATGQLHPPGGAYLQSGGGAPASNAANGRADGGGYAPALQPPAFQVAARDASAAPGRANADCTGQPASDAAGCIVQLASTVFPMDRALSAAVSLPLGALVTPLAHFPEGIAPPPVLRRPPVTCEHCGGLVNMYCQVNARDGSWECVFCRKRNAATGVLFVQDVQTCPELAVAAVDYLQQEYTPGAEAAPRPPVVIALDTTADADDLESLKQALLKVLASLPPTISIALITFAAAVSVYHLAPPAGGPNIASADAYPGTESQNLNSHVTPSDAVLGRLFAAAGGYTATLGKCRATTEAVLSSLRPQHQGLPARQRPRCLGAALEIALCLARGQAGAAQPSSPLQPQGQQAVHRPRGRVLVITTGPTTKGPGVVPLGAIDGDAAPQDAYAEREARSYLGWLADTAAGAGVTVDILAAGLAAVNAPLLAPLATQTGGILSLHEGVGPLFGDAVAATLQRRVGTAGGLDIKVSPGVLVRQVIGPAVTIQPKKGGLGSLVGSAKAQPRSSALVCQLNGVERGQGLALYLEAAAEIEADYVFLQVVVGWVTEEDGSVLERVVTLKLPTTRSPAVVLERLHPPTAAVLLGKRIVAEAQRIGAARDRGKADTLSTAIGRQLIHLASRLGTSEEVAGSGWFAGSTKRWLLPPELALIQQALYHLQRGPMLGHMVAGHADERALLQALFLNAAPATALRCLLPQLFMLSRVTRRFEEVPPLDVALWSDTALVLDHGTHIFVWLGADIPAAALNSTPAATPAPAGEPSSGSGTINGWDRGFVDGECQRFVAGLAVGRFPVPEVRAAVEGTGDARYIVARLVPAHRDSLAEQEAQLPVLARLTPAARSDLSARLATSAPTEEASLYQWCRHYKVEPARSSTDALAARLGQQHLQD